MSESDEVPSGIDRRELMAGAAAGAGTATMMWFWVEGFGNPLRRRRVEPTPPAGPLKTFTAGEWRTLAAAQDRLLPSSPGSPGARDVNATNYLDAVLAEPEIEPGIATLIKDGAGKLDERAKQASAPSFDRLTPEQQDKAIQVFETTLGGLEWLKKTIYFTLEAFLGDPVHGGNVGEAGWKWLAHVPGSPRPTVPNWRPKVR